MKRTWKYNMLYLKMVKENDYNKNNYVWTGRKWIHKNINPLENLSIQLSETLSMMTSFAMTVAEASTNMLGINNKSLTANIHKGEGNETRN